jgi:hypothetical protein
MADVTQIIQNVWFKILNIGSLGFLGIPDGSVVLAFTRILIWIFIFAILYALIDSLASKILKRPQALIISGVLATVSAIFIPAQVLAATGAGWATAVSLFLIGAPIVSLAFLIYKLPNKPCFWNFIKALLALLILWIVGAMETHLKSFGKYTVTNLTQQFLDWSWWICLIVCIYYVLRMITCWFAKSDSGDTRNFWRNIQKILQPFRRGDSGDGDGGGDTPSRDPDNMDYSPTPPPGPGPSRPSDPEFKPDDFKSGIPKDKKTGPPIPPYEPKKPKPPKDKRIFVDLSPWFLDVRSQGRSAACTAFSGASIVEYIINRVQGKKWKYLSPLFLWFNSRADKSLDIGSYLHNVVPYLTNQGDCLEELWSFEDTKTNKYLNTPSNDCYEDALKKRISGVRRLSFNNADEWVQALIEENPIYFAAGISPNFFNCAGPFYGETPDGFAGGHALVMVGYDSQYKHGSETVEAFKVRNSWGHRWGHNGYVWIPRKTMEVMLSHYYFDPPLVLTGWQKHLPKTKCQIVGRAIFEDHNDGEMGETGKKIYDYYPHGVDHKFIVGAMAQINGGLRELTETTVNNTRGNFILKFEEEVSRFERLTELPKQYKFQFNHINFKKLPPGVVVYKKSPDSSDKFVYFHVVDFKHSKRGRGGEGKDHPENPCSATVRRGIKHSGVPIGFSNEYIDERHVIIPVYPVYTVKDKEPIKKFSTLAKKEKEWVDSGNDFVKDLKSKLHFEPQEPGHWVSKDDIDHVDGQLRDIKDYISQGMELGNKITAFEKTHADALKASAMNLPEDKREKYLRIIEEFVKINGRLRSKVFGPNKLNVLLSELRIIRHQLDSAQKQKASQDSWRKFEGLIAKLNLLLVSLEDDLSFFSTGLEKLVVS